MAIRPNPNRQYDELKAVAVKARQPYDRDFWLNIAFYLDEQYVEWSDDVASIRKIPRRAGFENTPRPVANKIMHFVCQEHAMALQAQPTSDVLPATDNPLDISDSQVARGYLDWFSTPQVANFDGELSDATMWALAGGEGYLKWTYNPRLERPDVMSVPFQDVYPDPYAKRFDKSRYVIHSQFMDVEQVYDIWGIEVKPADVAKADPTKAALLRSMGQAPVLQGAIVNELWMKPNRRHKDGLYVVWTGREQLVAPGKFPYAHGRLPFTQLGSVPRPGSPHYTCAVKYLRAPQMELNKYHAQKIMGREAFVNYKWWIPNGVELEEDPDDSPRQILRGNSPSDLKPEILTPPPLPDGNDGQWITEEMMNVVGLHEVSQAQVPGRVEAARAIELLKESDNSRLAELQRTTRLAISEGFWQILMLAKQYVDEDVMVQTYSREGVPEVKRFKSEQIKPGMRIRVTMGTGLGNSRAARQDLLMQMWMNGVIRDPEVMANLMEVPLQTFTPDVVYDVRLAKNENLTIADGDAVAPNSWDNHVIHLREHNNYRKTADFMALSDEAKTKFEFHCQEHDRLQIASLEKEVQKQQLIMQIAQGPAPPPDLAQQAQDPNSPDAQFNTPQARASMQDFQAHNLSRAQST